MPNGAFRVHRDQQNPRDIHFEFDDGLTVPDDQAGLRDDVDRTLSVIRLLFKDGDPRFEEYFRQLLSLAQAGLVGPTANPAVARRALVALRSDITAREGGRVKNSYMKDLGRKAALAAMLVVGSALALDEWTSIDQAVVGILLMLGGCMAGVWLSFGIRKTSVEFESLHILEEDRLEPVVRLAFAGLLAVTIGLLFLTGAVSVTVGSLSTADLASKPVTALLIGLLLGVSEQALSAKITAQAGALLKF